jgi:hypothetical protein
MDSSSSLGSAGTSSVGGSVGGPLGRISADANSSIAVDTSSTSSPTTASSPSIVSAGNNLGSGSNLGFLASLQTEVDGYLSGSPHGPGLDLRQLLNNRA